jgi:transcriptional regulator with XRE-family HTH domain
MQTMPTVGERLKALRAARGWSQSELARRSGVSQAYIWQIEKGVRGENLGLDTVRKLAHALDVTPDEANMMRWSPGSGLASPRMMWRAPMAPCACWARAAR